MAIALFVMLRGWVIAAPDANRLTTLDGSDPFHPGLASARFTTPQWIGETNVEAVVILSIDDLRATAKYETHLRPVLERLKRIDGRAAFSIFCNACPTDDPQFATWLREGVSLEVHTLAHPRPLLSTNGFAAAANNFFGGIDLIAGIPGNHPVAFRMPCCDSMNSASPRFYAELFHRTSPEGRWLSMDSSVMMLYTTNDPSLPRELVVEGGHERFRKYFPTPAAGSAKVSLGAFAGYIRDYPYPYVIGPGCWEFPCAVPSDWEAFNAHGATNSATLSDWKAALDATVIKQGVMTLILHPHGWSSPQQLVALIDYAVETYGSKVKFLTFPEALARIEKNALAGESLRARNGGDNGVRLLDVDGDGFMDVVIGNGTRQVTRLWQQGSRTWRETPTPTPLVRDGTSTQVRFGIVRSGSVALLAPGDRLGAWEFSDGIWSAQPELLLGLEGVLSGAAGIDRGLRLRDLDHDGRCELILSNPERSGIYGWSEPMKRWQKLDYTLPADVTLVNTRGEDNGVRFVDLNGDGFEDVLASNEQGYSIHLWAAHVKDYLGWKRGWSHEIVRNTRGDKPGPREIPPLTRDDHNNGAWFHDGYLVVQNEETAALPDKVWRRSFHDLIAFDMPPPKSPEESRASIRVRPGFKVELAATEPVVISPMAFEWDATGRLWVVAVHRR